MIIDILIFFLFNLGQYIKLNEFPVEHSQKFCNDLWKVIRSAIAKYLDINDPNCFQPPTEFQVIKIFEIKKNKIFYFS